MLNENQVFWSNLEKIKDTLLLDDLGFAGRLGLTYQEYLKYRRGVHFLPVDCLYELAETLNFHFMDLMQPNFVLKNPFSPEVPLVDRYTLAAHSQTRPINNILNYLELSKGTRAKTNLIRKFQLDEDFITNEKNKANILLITDIVKYLSRTHGFTEQDFLKIGQRMPFLATNTILRDKLSNHKTAMATLECFVYECTRLFDTNCTYRISEFSDEAAVVEVVPNKSVVDELKIMPHELGSEEVCLTRMGNISSVTMYKYGRNANIKKVSSIHDGAFSNKYEFDLTAFKKVDPSSFPENVIPLRPFLQ
nr:hypothetical protein BHI3_18860 [Bacteriovorax sp. HI3]